MAAVSKTVCFDKLHDVVNEYKNIYRRTIKMKPVDDKTYIDSVKEVND